LEEKKEIGTQETKGTRFAWKRANVEQEIQKSVNNGTIYTSSAKERREKEVHHMEIHVFTRTGTNGVAKGHRQKQKQCGNLPGTISVEAIMMKG